MCAKYQMGQEDNEREIPARSTGLASVAVVSDGAVLPWRRWKWERCATPSASHRQWSTPQARERPSAGGEGASVSGPTQALLHGAMTPTPEKYWTSTQNPVAGHQTDIRQH
jgi:hypothetical protein